jgi:SSS family solute:Na+ symporter
MLWQIPNAATKHAHFGGSAFPLSKFGFDSTKSIYVGFVAVLVNLAVAAIVTLILRATKVTDSGDDTAPEDYTADAGDEQAPQGEGGGDADKEDLAPEPIT